MIQQRARASIAFAAALLALLAAAARAEVAGTGTFDISLDVGIPSTTFNGMLEILGDADGRMHGRFTGTFACRPTEVERTFNVPPGGRL
jgi:hypothetical protein